VSELPALELTANDGAETASEGAASPVGDVLVLRRPSEPARDGDLEVAERLASRGLGGARALAPKAWRTSEAGRTRLLLNGTIWAPRSLTQVTVSGGDDLARLHEALDALVAAIAWR